MTVVRALALSLALLAPLHGHAQCDARLQCCATAPPGGDPSAGGSCGADDPAQPPAPPPGTGAGNPLDILSGNKYQRETDMPRLPGALGLELVRHYNSGTSHRDTAGLGLGSADAATGDMDKATSQRTENSSMTSHIHCCEDIANHSKTTLYRLCL